MIIPVFRILIRMDALILVGWIRIQEGKNDPQR